MVWAINTVAPLFLATLFRDNPMGQLVPPQNDREGATRTYPEKALSRRPNLSSSLPLFQEQGPKSQCSMVVGLVVTHDLNF